MGKKIDADALIKEFREEQDVYYGRGDDVYVSGILHGLNIAIREVREAPAVEDTTEEANGDA